MLAVGEGVPFENATAKNEIGQFKNKHKHISSIHQSKWELYIKRRKIDRYSGNEINLCTKNLKYLKYLLFKGENKHGYFVSALHILPTM